MKIQLLEHGKNSVTDRQGKNQLEIEDLPKCPHLESMDKQLHHHSITTVFCGMRLIIHVHPDS